jgi:hypothetical protein
LLEADAGRSIRRSIPLLSVGSAALGAIALALRDVSPGGVVITVVVGAAALLVPLPVERPTPGAVRRSVIALGVGTGVFAVVAWLSPALAGPLSAARWAPATASAAAASIAAAVFEEALCRRLVYGLLRPLGLSAAVGGAAVVFALVHVPVYGWSTVPLNLAAGLVLGWQRAASGTWAIPAVTHAAANVVAFL